MRFKIVISATGDDPEPAAKLCAEQLKDEGCVIVSAAVSYEDGNVSLIEGAAAGE